ncbi:MAG: DNA polymerase III subunit delta' [Firmicutes bacterium]|nr:DNA polymerase III subunit delta' [Bacillota bacterium]
MLAFSEIIGQDRAKKILQRTIRTGRVGHAYLLVGPEGTGKKSLALAFAAALNCSAENKPCGLCRSCRRIAEGNHPDLVVFEPEGRSFKIEQIRRLQQLIAFKPYEGNYKVFILDGAESFTDQAANSLLKTLEEPPLHSVLILLANKNLLLPTITSRCTVVPVQPLPDETIAQVLQERGVSDGERIASVSGGSLGKALRIAGEWAELGEPVQRFLAAVQGNRPWDLGKDLYAQFKESPDFRELFLDLCQEEYKKKAISQKMLGVRALEEIEKGREMLKYNVNPDAVLRSLSIKLANIQRRAF